MTDRPTDIEPAYPIDKTPETPDPVEQTRLIEYVFLLPRLLGLVWKLMRDPRVPPRQKAMMVFVAGYVVSPIDLIPFIPGLGQLDDLFVIALALDRLLNHIDESIILEHWSGDEDVLGVVREILAHASGIVPDRLKRFFPDN